MGLKFYAFSFSIISFRVPQVSEAELDEDSGSNPCRWRGANR